jgi:hypothetical protein
MRYVFPIQQTALHAITLQITEAIVFFVEYGAYIALLTYNNIRSAYL